jgi:chemotaxis protein MotB
LQISEDMMRRRRRLRDDHENHDRWLVSYADFITLLFAFFVVMYALSSVNEGKYRVLSESLVSAFKNETQSGAGETVLPGPPPVHRPAAKPKSAAQVARAEQTERMKKIAEDITRVMSPYVTRGQVAVIETERGITVEINDSMLFPAGRAELNAPAERAMRNVATVIAPTEFPVTIEGHTDNTPINTPQFPSNWELSAVRATTVLRLMLDSGISGSRLTAIGYGEQRPVADNAQPEGRARNRRVAILLEAAVPATN